MSASDFIKSALIITNLRGMVRRLIVEQFPCSKCRFVFATYGQYDAAMGLGPPIFCVRCVPDKEDWRQVPRTHYSAVVQRALTMLEMTK